LSFFIDFTLNFLISKWQKLILQTVFFYWLHGLIMMDDIFVYYRMIHDWFYLNLIWLGLNALMFKNIIFYIIFL